ncbi:MAG: septum formation initiator family protein [Rhodospirillales bacterium]|nr:septum formation initiator family protein [Rhodospirillales bacterium]
MLGALTVIYFGYHTIQGDRGLLAWWHLRHEVQQADAELQRIVAVRQALEHRASLLRPDNLDLDMLEERARVMLNAGRSDEIVIFDGAREDWR